MAENQSSAPYVKRPWMRQQFIINPKFQFSLIGYTVVTAALVLAILYCADLYFFYKFSETGKQLGLPETHVYFQFLSEQRLFMNKVFMIVGGIIFSVLSVAGVLISHRIAGPLYRICRHMADVADAKTEREVKFRKGDFFPELAEAYNRQLRFFKEKQGDRKGKDAAA